MDTLVRIVGSVIVGFLIVVGTAILMTLPTYYLWNWLMPMLFGFKTLTLVQVWGVNVLSGSLFRTTVTQKERPKVEKKDT